MTLQQLKYVIGVAECGSITKASQKLLVAQPSLSKSIADLEDEMGITIFYRNNRGVYLSDEGSKFLSYARQVIEQTQLLEQQYKKKEQIKRVFAISAQHYAFVVNAFVALVKELGKDKYDFTLRESKTYDIIEDVANARSELGVLFLSNFNQDVVMRIIKKYDLEYKELFVAKPHIFVWRNSPLAKKEYVTLDELKDYPRLTYEQGINNSFYFSEEPYSTAESNKNIVVTDRATLFNLLIGLDGYTIASGILSEDLNGSDIVSVPIKDTDEVMRIGFITSLDRPINKVTSRYLELLNEYIKNYLKILEK